MKEVGRELGVADLKPQQVVVIAPPDRDVLITMWVEAVEENFVAFFSNNMKWHVINFVKDGRIVDDRDRVVRVFEFLGKI